ncbi:sensor histidine kinase, Cache_1 and HAMP domain-containing [Geotalea daltonii FRC-32]|uniref:histidine kinase n=1 Tax=Geotalea daltonii (strain DSM 22248 / JCM 15807 / FRC-32) TaxID=316067 RepID=B9M5M5_GEODF|nr:cache domain-containing protein [Geotalea daltonii]ACM21784.1 sensor histidine kinase, Cache_1 and HAMP domain-containing [Geotalea daltonii FRC-32]
MKKKITLKNALFIITLLTVLTPIMVIGLVADRFLFQDLRNDIARQNKNLATAVAGEVSSHLEGQLKIVRQLAEQLDMDPALKKSKNLNLILNAEIAADEFFESIFVLDARGKVSHVGYRRASGMIRENYLGIDFTGQDFYRKASREGEIYWSGTFISPISGEPTVAVSVPIDGGLVIANVNLRELTNITKQLDNTSYSYVYVVNRAGNVIAHPDDKIVRQQFNLNNLPIISDGLAGRFGTYRYTFLGKEKEGTAVQIPETGWLVVVAHDVEEAYAPVKKTERIFLLGLLAALFFSVLAATWSLNKILLPLNRLMTNAQKLAGGDYSLVPVPGEFREIEALSGAFAYMADAINKREEELMERNEELTSIEEELRQQIDEYLHSQDELSKSHAEVRRLNEELEQRVAERTLQLETANKELESFCYSVSHDLRAPLRHINGFSQALLEDCLASLDEQGQNYLRRICAATDRMGLLIDDLLELSRVSRNEMKHEQVNLSEMAWSIIEMFKETAPQRDASFKSVADIVVSGDRNLLRLVMENLLGNAWKYTSKKQEASIVFDSIIKEGEQIFFVRDNGVGFDMTYSGKLFGAFQRLHSEADFEGTGIGLATVQRIIHRHGGRVWGEGEVGKGATFYFTLPQSAPIP